jgi:hypothetical protein
MDIRMARAVLSMQANFVVMGAVQEAREAGALEHLRIGLVGCGMIGRLLLHNILVLTKENLKISNIIVSTRRPEELEVYSRLGVSCMFDNELCVGQADLIFFCTPDTLDNWIFTGLAEHAGRRQAEPRALPLRVLHFSQRLNSSQLEHIMGLPSCVIKLHAPAPLLEGYYELLAQTNPDPLAKSHEKLEGVAFEHSRETLADCARVLGLAEEGLREAWMKRLRMWRLAFYNYRA